MPKSVLYYVLDKGQYFDLESVFTHSCFPNKETESSLVLKITNTWLSKEVYLINSKSNLDLQQRSVVKFVGIS